MAKVHEPLERCVRFHEAIRPVHMEAARLLVEIADCEIHGALVRYFPCENASTGYLQRGRRAGMAAGGVRESHANVR